MSYKRVLTIQDISCLGQCSGSVALPIISACGHECCLLPSAVLSTHTGGFTGYTFMDLTPEIPKIHEHWKKEGVKFDCIYTGYLGSTEQIKYVVDFFDDMLALGGIKVVDPAMADNGKLYTGFDEEYVRAMAHLCAEADVILPNLTEACMMTGCEYRTEYDQQYIMDVLSALDSMGAKCIILTGVGFREGATGVVVYEGGFYSYYEHTKISEGCHGTGDVYASAFVGALLKNKGAVEAACIAADFTVDCIIATNEDKDTEKSGVGAAFSRVSDRPGHWYGVEFEKVLPELIKRI